MKIISIFTFLSILLIVNLPTSGFAGPSPEAANRIEMLVTTTDKPLHYVFEGEQASIAFTMTDENTLNMFTINANSEKFGGFLMSSGIMTLDLRSRDEQVGTSWSSILYNTDAEETPWQDKFSSQFWPLYYDTTADGSESNTIVQLTKVERLDDGYMLLEGTFRFNASNSPDPEHLSDACMQDALANSGRHPVYKAELAGTDKRQVRGTFHIAILAKPFGW